ncbi:hypothetical protein Ahy_A08g039444 isoform B [Arachis hypogaea]|uniref:Uncharacterized protein n=1 Tax=Arachis hypogaea TaxID=3818 RepID=A0A445BWT9_ARAHY|nr:hypothetical protein Ahy_A08g039444 isoform B [Arachis hypogaea]
MVLQNDIDLLNPPAELEKRKHKLKRLVQSPNSFFTVFSLLLSFPIFFGCEVPRLFQHYHCIQPLSDRRGMRKLLDSIVPADRRPSEADRGLLF